MAAKDFSVSSPTAAPAGPGGVRAGRSTGGAGAAGRSPGRLCALRCAAHDEHIREYLTREAAGTMGTKEAPVQLQELALPQAVRARTDAERANSPPRQPQAACLARANRCSSAPRLNGVAVFAPAAPHRPGIASASLPASTVTTATARAAATTSKMPPSATQPSKPH